MIKKEIESLPPEKNLRNLLIYMCHRHNRMNLTDLLEFLGEEKFVEFIERFGGSYIRIPAPDRISNCIDHYRMLLLYNRINKFYKEKKLADWEEAERQFKLVCSRNHIRYETGFKLAKDTRGRIANALSWYVKLLELERDQNKKDVE